MKEATGVGFRPGGVHNMRPPDVVYPRITHIILLLQAYAVFI